MRNVDVGVLHRVESLLHDVRSLLPDEVCPLSEVHRCRVALLLDLNYEELVVNLVKVIGLSEYGDFRFLKGAQ